MEADEVVLWSVLGFFVLGAISGLAWAIRRRPASAPRAQDDLIDAQGSVSVTLDIDAVNAPDERVQRIMREASGRIFAAMPNVDRVELIDRSGAVLGVHRRQRIDLAPPIEVPEEHAAVRHDVATWMSPIAPGEPVQPGESARPTTMPQTPYVEPPRRHAPLAERVDLPDAVRTVMQPVTDAVEVVRAILEAAGHSPVVDGDLIRAGNRVLIVLADPETSSDALNHAYFRFKASRAAEGFVVVTGLLDPVDARRRERLEPALTHLGVAGVQRMADAVALGADPLRFARAPVMEIHPTHTVRAS